ncbi:MAG: hypothetical protein V3V76_01990 [Candidatus Adiutricales bacterium]
MAPDRLSASGIAENIDQVLSPLLDLVPDHFLAPPRREQKGKE